MNPGRPSTRAFNRQLKRLYGLYTAAFVLFVIAMGLFERVGMARTTVGYVFLAATVLAYAGIGILTRTNDATEYYVAGRRVPAMFNGMATAADWISAASFIGLAGSLYLNGYAGLAYVMGWTGGYVLIAVFLAPYLRKFGQYTIPDFFGARYGGHIPRLIALLIVCLISFTYVVAQIYGVGLITTRLTQVPFEVGIWLGLGGVLVCSFLGGMRAVTWTQVAQYIILAIAYLVPVIWLSVQQTGVPVPQLIYGQQLAKVTALEKQLAQDPAELEVRRLFAERAALAREHLKDPAAALARGRQALEAEFAAARLAGDDARRQRAEAALGNWPVDEASARKRWLAEARLDERAKPPRPHAEPFPGATQAERDVGRRNFLALVFCLTLGTAALPHILMRFYTTSSVREARRSVGWSLFFIFLVYFTAPALAVLVKYVIYEDVVGLAYTALPEWVSAWQHVDSGLLSVADINGDGRVQLAEIAIGADIIVLATPEIAGLPYVISGLVAAGGLAAALSTADGLLLSIANALSHDLYHRMLYPEAPTARRVMISKVLLLIVAALAAVVAAQGAGDILFLVSAAFSLAASSFFPALVLGIFWKRTTGLGATLGMLAGLTMTLGYMASFEPWLRSLVFNVPLDVPVQGLWWGIEPIAAGVFGIPVAFVVTVLVSLITPTPSRQTTDLVESIRYPNTRPMTRP